MPASYDILVIDDEQIILDAITRICKAYQLNVDAVRHAADVQRHLEKNRYRLILCDLMMPDIDGFQLLNTVRASTMDTPIIIMTGFSTAENTVKALFSGAIDFIPKPFSEEELIASVLRGLKYAETQQDDHCLSKCPEDYFCLGIISWVNMAKDGTAQIGLTKSFLELMEGIQKIELLENNAQIFQGLPCGTLKTGSVSHRFLSPLSGRIVMCNDGLQENIDLLINDPYVHGWIYRIIPSELAYDMQYLTPGKSKI